LVQVTEAGTQWPPTSPSSSWAWLQPRHHHEPTE
jgi:hypothetical protein